MGAHVCLHVIAKGWCWVSSFNTLRFIFKSLFLLFYVLVYGVCTHVSECHMCDTVLLQGHERVSDLLMLNCRQLWTAPHRCCKYPAAPYLVSLWALSSLILIGFLANQFLRSIPPAQYYKWEPPCLPFHWIQVFTFTWQGLYPSGLTFFVRDEAGCPQGGLVIDLMLSLIPPISDWEPWSTALIPVLGKWVQASLHSKT